MAADDIDAVLDDLERLGLLDDSAFARALARNRIRHKPRGRRRIVQELRGKGVSAEKAEAALDEALDEEGTDEEALARRAGARWARTQGVGVLEALTESGFSDSREKARRKLYAYLARRGFSGPARSAGVEAALEEAEHRLRGD